MTHLKVKKIKYVITSTHIQYEQLELIANPSDCAV